VEIAWPGAVTSVDGARENPTTGHAWFGSLIAGGADGSGMLYQRNRYYDPQTGRFTQEDPIGLAGGMNAYGFAGGDRINFGDPFGTCPPVWLCAAIGANAGESAAEYWASVASSSSGLKAAGANVAGGLASLWTPDTYARTAGAFTAAGRVEGIYEFVTKGGELYVGQSGDVANRLDQHVNSGKLDAGSSVGVSAVPGGKTTREIAEQKRINEHGGIQNLANQRNPIGAKRQHLLGPPDK
jgi:RHS repeat-associated protein